MNRFKAREKVILELNNQNKIEKSLKNKMVIPLGDRSGEVIEPLLTADKQNKILSNDMDKYF